jgi:hypothetical protein
MRTNSIVIAHAPEGIGRPHGGRRGRDFAVAVAVPGRRHGPGRAGGGEGKSRPVRYDGVDLLVFTADAVSSWVRRRARPLSRRRLLMLGGYQIGRIKYRTTLVTEGEGGDQISFLRSGDRGEHGRIVCVIEDKQPASPGTSHPERYSRSFRIAVGVKKRETRGAWCVTGTSARLRCVVIKKTTCGVCGNGPAHPDAVH